MGRWNYRVFRSKADDGTDILSIRETYYEDEGDPPRVNGWGTDPAWPAGETLEELREDYERMEDAFDRPILDEEDLEAAHD